MLHTLVTTRATVHRNDIEDFNNSYGMGTDRSDGYVLNLYMPVKQQNCHNVNDCYIVIAGLRKKETNILNDEIVLYLSYRQDRYVQQQVEASSQQAKSWAFCVLTLKMSRCLPGILKPSSIYFDPVNQLPELPIRERIEQIREDV